MRSQAKAAREVPFKVHEIDKVLDPYVKPEQHQSKSVTQITHTPAPKRSNVRSLVKKLISKTSNDKWRKHHNVLHLTEMICLCPPSSLPPILPKHTWQVTHKVPLPPSSPILGENVGDLVPIGKYSSNLCHIDPIPDLDTDTGSSEEILYLEYWIPTD